MTGGSCASADRWYHQLDRQGAEPSSRCDGSGSKRAHGGCSCRRRASKWVRGFVPVEVVSRWSGLIPHSRLRDAGQRRSGSCRRHATNNQPHPTSFTACRSAPRSSHALHFARLRRDRRSLSLPDPNTRASPRLAAIPSCRRRARKSRAPPSRRHRDPLQSRLLTQRVDAPPSRR